MSSKPSPQNLSLVVGAVAAVLASWALARTVATGAAPPTATAVRQAIMDDPSLVQEALDLLAQRTATRQQATERAASASAAADLAVPQPGLIGNPTGRHLVVEFFDYQCGFCRSAEPKLLEEARKDPELRVVQRELAILGEGSQIAARVAMAADIQGLYPKVHANLMATSLPITLQSALDAASAAGADLGKLRVDMVSPAVGARLAADAELASKLGVVGTPTFASPVSGLLAGFPGPASFEAFAAASGENGNPAAKGDTSR